jgi:hypothetical protein
MCGGTHTAKTIMKFYGLSITLTEKLKSEVAQQLEVSEKVVEAGTCEMFRESDYIGQADMYIFDESKHEAELVERHARLDHPDTFFFGQRIFLVENNQRYELKLDRNGKETTVLLPFSPPNTQTTGLVEGWVGVKLSKEVYDREIKTSCFSYFKGMKPKVHQKRKAVLHSGFGIHLGLESTLRERDRMRMGHHLENYDSDADDPINEFRSNYLRPIHRYNIIQTRGSRTLRGDRLVVHPTDMILQANSDDGTYAIFDVDREVYKILHSYTSEVKRGWKKSLWNETVTTELSPTCCTFGYTASAQGPSFRRLGGIKAAIPGQNCFWETGFVGVFKGRTYYSSWENARRSASIRILVDYGCYVTNQQSQQVNFWATKHFNKLSKGNTFVVLYENKGGGRHTSSVLGILMKKEGGMILLVPKQNTSKPWKEIQLKATSTWDKNINTK